MKRFGPRGLAWALLIAGVAAAQVPADAPAVHASFDHARHERALEREGLACTACHTIGAQGTDDDAAALAAPPGACHACHVEREGRQTRAPSRCTTCHVTVAPPDDHGPGWREVHGVASRTRRCNDCHRGSFCVDCHERREPVRFAVHDRSFLGVHGIEARTDPTGCGGCHVGAYCVACHGRGPR